MKKIILIIIILLLSIIENTILPSYSLNGSFPSLVFVFVIAFSIINETEDAMFVGIASGILQDVYFFSGFGANLLLNFLLCLLASRIGKGIYIRNKFIPVLSVLVLSMLKAFGVMIIFYIFDKSINLTTALISSLMNAILMIIVYKWILNASKKYWKKDTWRFK